MKRFLILACLVAVVGGCVVLPVDAPGHGHREYHSYGYDDGYRWHGRGPYYRRDAGYHR
jgi:hypothetical protein